MTKEQPDDGRLRELFSQAVEIAGSGDDCPPAEQVVLSGRGELDPAEDEKVILHISRCTACGAAWKVARDVADGAVSEPRPVVAPRPFHHRRWFRLVGVAALLAGAVGLGSIVLLPTREPAPIYREQEDGLLQSRLVEEQPLSREQFVLSWSAGPEGTAYDVAVTTDRLQPVARGFGLDRPEYQVSRRALEGVEPGSRLFWQVTAHLPDGRRVESQTFVARVE